MENSYTATETSPLFSSALTNKHNSLVTTLSKLQKETLSNSLNHIIDNSSELTEEKQELIQNDDNMKDIEVIEPIDPQELVKAQEQRRTLLDALISALNNFTSQFSEEEGNEVVAAVLESHLNRFHPQSKSFDMSRPRNGT